MKPILAVALILALTGCTRSTTQAEGDATVRPPPPPVDENREPCPDGTEIRGGPPPGGIEESCQKPDGTLHGRSTIWHTSGHKAAEGEYRDNRKHGTWTYWHINGKMASQGGYQDGKRHGDWTFWHESGEKSEEGEYQAGREQGTWSTWDESGKSTGETTYRDGIQVPK